MLLYYYWYIRVQMYDLRKYTTTNKTPTWLPPSYVSHGSRLQTEATNCMVCWTAHKYASGENRTCCSLVPDCSRQRRAWHIAGRTKEVNLHRHKVVVLAIFWETVSCQLRLRIWYENGSMTAYIVILVKLSVQHWLFFGFGSHSGGVM